MRLFFGLVSIHRQRRRHSIAGERSGARQTAGDCFAFTYGKCFYRSLPALASTRLLGPPIHKKMIRRQRVVINRATHLTRAVSD